VGVSTFMAPHILEDCLFQLESVLAVSCHTAVSFDTELT
jgi:hypothetical protein